MKKRQDAPGTLELVRAFVNSADLENDTDELAEPPALRGWLAARGIAELGRDPSAEEVERAIAVREALRALLHANNGAPLDPSAPAVLDDAAARAGLRVTFPADGRATTRPHVGGVDGAIGLVLAQVASAQADGTWARLKACPQELCEWAFYDHTKNRSGRWCQMGECGNRAKARRYRERHPRS